jgi:hypothetical protein
MPVGIPKARHECRAIAAATRNERKVRPIIVPEEKGKRGKEGCQCSRSDRRYLRSGGDRK